MKLTAKARFLAAIAAISLSSCATIISGSKQTFMLNTKPEDATVTVLDKKGNTVFSGQTPAQVRLKSGAGYFSPAKYEITFTKPGFESQTIPVHFKINGWYFGNIFLGGAIGLLIVDPLTGGMWTINEPAKNILRTLKTRDGIALEVIELKDLTSDQRASLVKLQ
ncbi:hypothetical protein ACQKLP_12275 [Chitinophaga sp. NPDC101104]|uniref:carboxypeptidase-like regulatory domain-containing protein n=1 Tax=Chitinophaga sp. NPDC101104 TaxID=3390561 RepID=UPI003D04F476